MKRREAAQKKSKRSRANNRPYRDYMTRGECHAQYGCKYIPRDVFGELMLAGAVRVVGPGQAAGTVEGGIVTYPNYDAKGALHFLRRDSKWFVIELTDDGTPIS